MTTRLAAGRSRFAGAGRRASALVAAVVGLLISASLAAAQEPITPNAGAAPNRFAATNPTEASAAVERSPEQSSTSPASSPGADGLAPRLTLGAPDKESGTKSERLTAPGSWTGLFAAAVVAGGAGLCLWFLRSGGAGLGRRLPEDVLMVLGRASFADKQSLHVVRFGGKLLLVNVAPGGSRTLAEIDDPAEVDRLETLCRSDSKRSVAATSTPSVSLPGLSLKATPSSKRSSRLRESADA